MVLVKDVCIGRLHFTAKVVQDILKAEGLRVSGARDVSNVTKHIRLRFEHFATRVRGAPDRPNAGGLFIWRHKKVNMVIALTCANAAANEVCC